MVSSTDDERRLRLWRIAECSPTYGSENSYKSPEVLSGLTLGTAS